jgi:hypothetical protein
MVCSVLLIPREAKRPHRAIPMPKSGRGILPQALYAALRQADALGLASES